MPLGPTPLLSEIQDEFGIPAGSAFFSTAFTRGGLYVPEVSANTAISTTAAGLRLSQFANASSRGSVSVTQGSVGTDGDGGWGWSTPGSFGSGSGDLTKSSRVIKGLFLNEYTVKGVINRTFNMVVSGTSTPVPFSNIYLPGGDVLDLNDSTFFEASGDLSIIWDEVHFNSATVQTNWDGSGGLTVEWD